MKEGQNAETLINLIKDIKFTMMTTVGPNGEIHSRPMGTIQTSAKNFDGTLWFFSKKNSTKNHDIQNDQHVNLAYADPENHHYVSIKGRAFVSTDKDRMSKLWNSTLKVWFPEGLNDPDISLIGVKVEDAEVWDSPPGKMVQLIDYVKSRVTGKPIDQRSHGQHIEIRQ